MPAFDPLPFPARIGLVADTHLIRPRPLPASLVDGLAGCDLIFHAGDISRAWVLERLAEIAPVYAVYGNNDSGDLELMRELPFERHFACGPHRIGLIHGHDPLGTRRVTARQFVGRHLRGVVDWAVYGHSHRPLIEEQDGLWMVNPGSPTQPRWAPRATWGILQVGAEVRARLIDL